MVGNPGIRHPAETAVAVDDGTRFESSHHHWRRTELRDAAKGRQRIAMAPRRRVATGEEFEERAPNPDLDPGSSRASPRRT